MADGSIPRILPACVVLKELQTALPVKLRHEGILAPVFVEHLIPEANAIRIVDVAAVIDLPDICPENGTLAHGAGLRRGIDLAAGQVVGSQLAAGIPDGLHFAVAGGVVAQKHPVVASADDFSVPHDHRAEGAAVTLADARIGLLNGLLHKIQFLIVHGKTSV